MKEYTELNTFNEVARAMRDKREVEFYIGEGVWVRAGKHGVPIRFRMIKDKPATPVFGDWIYVWNPGSKRHNRKFICFNGCGNPIILTKNERNTLSYKHWAWK